MCSLASGSSYHHETCSSTYYRFSHMVEMLHVPITPVGPFCSLNESCCEGAHDLRGTRQCQHLETSRIPYAYGASSHHRVS